MTFSAIRLIILLVLSLTFASFGIAYASPNVFEPNFEITKFANGLNFPVQMEFVGDDMLILEKDDGQVRLVRNDTLQEDPVLKLDVYHRGNLGLLGITSLDKYVFLYVSQNSTDSSEPVVNRIYRYTWDGNNLVEPKLINELPTGSAWDHSGGVLTKGLDNSVYAIIGDTLVSSGILQNDDSTISQNEKINYNDTSIILRVGIEPGVTRPNLSDNPLKHYYGMGIRNSYGLAIDPITGFLWETENGEYEYDEINLVMPNFNGGWNKIMGPATQSQVEALPKLDGFQYSDPEFSWQKPVAPTGITFAGEKWGDKYRDSLFVADYNTGTIYKFKLNSTRTGFDFKSPELKDLVANKGDSIRDIVFGIGFTSIFDIKMGPDNSMYVATEDGGIIYKISQSDGTKKIKPPTKQLEEGLTSSTISCIDGYVLVIKNTNNSVACVQPSTAVHLIERQWGVAELNPAKNCYSAPKPSVDWSNCNFSFRDLSGVNLEGVNLSGANLLGSNFSNSKLSGGNFYQGNMAFADFSGSDLVSSNMREARLPYSNFQNADLSKADISLAIAVYSDFANSDLSGSYIDRAYFSNVDFSFANLSNISAIDSFLEVTNMTGANLTNSNLEGTSFNEAILGDTKFTFCKNNDLCN
jgi:uncharacterized protein YjbI with pentapeptide repeats/glucose/arabinose dehydrogenase